MSELVLVHGRAQQDKNSVALKAEWLEALSEGLKKNGLSLPINESAVRFPFYGDTLRDLVEGSADSEAAQIIVRGTESDAEERQFMLSVLDEVRAKASITDEQVAQVSSREILQRGILNWEWVQTILRAVDRFVPYGSGTALALFTHDVYRYLTDSAIRQQIEDGISLAITPGVKTVVVAHSLGTVAAYNLLRREGHLRGWKVSLLVTVGSPLAIAAVRTTLKQFSPLRCPECVTGWFNAMDERDFVALYPLDSQRFPLDPTQPAIENKIDVRNRTENRHGIAGYLDDAEVAKRIYESMSEG